MADIEPLSERQIESVRAGLILKRGGYKGLNDEMREEMEREQHEAERHELERRAMEEHYRKHPHG